jgi:hypothetical protein
MTTVIIIYGCARVGEVDVSGKLAFDISLKLQLSVRPVTYGSFEFLILNLVNKTSPPSNENILF